jgi:hypothetical protein
MSVDKVLDIAKTITTLKIKLQESKETLSKTMLITPKHKSIAQIFGKIRRVSLWRSQEKPSISSKVCMPAGNFFIFQTIRICIILNMLVETDTKAA